MNTYFGTNSDNFDSGSLSTYYELGREIKNIGSK